jgi:hypothetical protein
VFCSFLFFLVNPIASSHFQNAQQQNITSQNYSLHPNNNNVPAMQMTNHQYDASSFNSSSNNFNHNFDPSNQSLQYQQQQQTFVAQQQTFEGGSHMTQQQQMYQSTQAQFYGQSAMMGHQNHTQGLNNGPTSTYQHTINDLLVHPTSSYQQPQQQQPAPTLYNNQVQTNQSVRYI